MRNYILFLLFAILFQANIFSQQNVLVKNIEEYNNAIKKATPGTTIILKNGVWKDVILHAFGIGKKENPIVVKAETAGQVILAGNSKVNIYGKYIVVTGFWFKDGNPTSKSIVSFRKNTKEAAYNCRFTNSTISYYNPVDKNVKSHWVDLWGKNNRVDHNNFTGKTNEGTTVAVWLKGDEHLENNHRIEYNFFGKRPELGKNGGETIRIGTSANSMKFSKTIVANNTFKNCDGEIEIISNKSGDNIFRNNLFIASKGTLTLRHGNNALVENNVFIGNNIPKTGGIRVINEGHIIRNNLLIGIKGTGFRAPIAIMNGVPNSPLHRYHQVKNVNIHNNTLINCSTIEFATGKDKERTLAPVNTIFANNLITNMDKTKILTIADNKSDITFRNNIVSADVVVDEAFFSKQEIDWKLLKSIPIPTDKNQQLISNFKNAQTPKLDISGAEREPFVVGAFNLNSVKYPKALTMITGPDWKPKIVVPKKRIKPKTIKVEPGKETFAKAFKKATLQTTFILDDGIYFIDKTKKVKGNITIIGSGNTIIKASDNLPKALNYFFRVEENTRLTLKNIIFDGDNDTQVKYAVVSPDKNNSKEYDLFIDGCAFKNFKNKNGGSVFKAYIGTLADTISIKNSKFLNSYRGLNLSYEKNNFGKCNANLIQIHNSVFKNIDEFAINYIKTGPYINSGNGRLEISNTVFSKVANTKKGKIIRAKGIPFVEIKHAVFENSFEIVNPINLSGIGGIIENCLVHVCGNIKTTKGAIQKNIIYKNPKWDDKKKFIPSKKSPLLKENNKIETMGLIQ